MTLAVNPLDALAAVQAELNYLKPMDARPRTYTFGPANAARTNQVSDLHTVPIRDARPIGANLSLDRHGFSLVRHRGAAVDFADEDQIRSTYYRESEQLLRQVTGADRVFIFDHTVRRRVPGAEDRRDGVRQPVTRVHVDHTARSGPQRVRDLLPDDADRLLAGRVQVINLWRPLRGPVQDAPLAVCDARSVAPEHLVAADLVYPDRIGETYAVLFDPAHRWFYVPAMQPDEVLFLKCYDSEVDGRARFAPHSAFIDPTAPSDALPRESIELRSLVFHLQ